MSDNVTLPATGAAVRTILRGGVQSQVQVLDIGGENGEALAVPSPSGNLSVNIAEAAGLTLPDGALGVTLTGDPNGDFAGVNVFEQLLDSGSGLTLNARVVSTAPVDVNTAPLVSDAPAAIAIGPLSAGQAQVIDTQGYQSLQITLQTLAGTLSASNDRQTWASPTLAASASASTAFANALAANTSYIIPCAARFIRITATTAGTATAFLRAQPWQGASYLAAAPTNIAYVGSTAAVTAGIAGLLAVGGNAGPGVAASANPTPVGGVDPSGLTRRIETDANGNLISAGLLPTGYQTGAYNVVYSPWTTAAASLTAAQSAIGPVIVGGVDRTGAVRATLTDPAGATYARAATATSAEQSDNDLLAQIAQQLRLTNHYLYEIYSQGQVSRTAGDEPDALLADFTHPASLFANMPN